MPLAARSLDILVVGAGLGGLAAGLALQTDGHRVTIVDSAPEFGEVRYSSTHKGSLCHLMLIFSFLTFSLL